MKDENYGKGKVVFRQGDPGDCMYYVRWGSVGVFADYGTPREKRLATLHHGDYFGEMGLIDGEARTATVVSLDWDTVLGRIDEDEFAEFLSENPARVHDILARLCHKLRDVTANYLEVCASVRQSVGDGAAEVDASSDYHFVENPYLVGVHDRVAQTMHDDA